MFRDCWCCMQNVPNTVSDEKVGTGMLAATSFGWVAKQIDLLTGEKRRSGVSIENIKTKGLRTLQESMVEYICKCIAKNRSAAPTSQAFKPADSVIDDDGAERQTSPQAAVAAQHQGNARVSAEGEEEEEEEEEDEAVTRKDKKDDEEEEEKDEKDDGDEEEEGKDGEGEGKDGEGEGKDEEGVEDEVEYGVEYVEVGGAVEAVGSADEKNEEAEDGDACNATRSADGGKEKDEVGVEASTEKGQEEAACEGGKVSVDAGEGANITGVQETREASGRQGPELDDVEELRRENWLLRAENARLATLLNAEQARLDRFFVGFSGLVDHVKGLAEQVDDTEKYAAEQLRNATAAMSETITGNITGSFDEAWKAMKTFTEQASAWLEDFDNPEGRVAYARARAIDGRSRDWGGGRSEVGFGAADIMKAATEATQQSFVAYGMKMMTEMIGTLASGRRGSSPSANDADHAQRRTADKQGLKRTGDGDDKESAKRSKGSDGSRGPKPAAQSVVDQLKKKAGWKVIRTSHSKGGRSGGAEGGPADGVAANVAAPPGPPLVAEQTHPQASGGKGVTDKEVPTAQVAKDGGAGTTKGPSVAVAAKGNAKAASASVTGTTKSNPRNHLAATSAPAGKSGANKDGEARAAPPAPAAPSTAQGDAKAALAKGDAPASAKGGPVADPSGPVADPIGPVASASGPVAAASGPVADLSGPFAAPIGPVAAASSPVVVASGPVAASSGPVATTCGPSLAPAMPPHSRDVQQHPVVDAGLAGTARRSVTPQVAGTSSGAPPAAPPVVAPPPADPKSAFLRAHLGARKAVTQPEPGNNTTPTSVNATAPSPGAAVVDAAAEQGVSAVLATGGRADKHAKLAAVLANFEAAKRPEHAPALAIMDFAHVVPSATHGEGSAEPTAATSAVAERNAGRKGKDNTGKGKAVSQRSTRAMSAGKEMSEEKGNQDKTGGKGKPAKKKEKAEEEDEEGGEGDKEHGRRGHGIRQDRSGDRHGWVGEIKVNVQNRYIGKSREKMELAYEHAIAYLVYDGYVSKVLMKELTVLKPGELDKWKEVWAEVKFLPTGMWTVMWARGLCQSRARQGRDDALMSAMVNRVSMCAAYGKVAASAAYGKVDASMEGKAGEKTEMEGAEGKADEKTEMGAQALAASTCAL
ncbi:unnamed protein product [Closterium sp. NIES-65]|nr:unnamed protein product [Closterium sp. NIES-65]